MNSSWAWMPGSEQGCRECFLISFWTSFIINSRYFLSMSSIISKLDSKYSLLMFFDTYPLYVRDRDRGRYGRVVQWAQVWVLPILCFLTTSSLSAAPSPFLHKSSVGGECLHHVPFVSGSRHTDGLIWVLSFQLLTGISTSSCRSFICMSPALWLTC